MISLIGDHSCQSRVKEVLQFGGLVSLKEMLRSYIAEFMNIHGYILTVETGLNSIDKEPAVRQTEELKGLKETLSIVLETLEDLSMTVGAGQCKELLRLLGEARQSDESTIDRSWWDECRHSVRTLLSIIEIESEQRKFFYVKPELTDHFEKNQFSVETQAQFPKAAFDMEEAGKCLALSRDSACVFHLMRLVDSCLKRLVSHFKVQPKNQNWGVVLNTLRIERDNIKKVDKDRAASLDFLIEKISALQGPRKKYDQSFR